MKGPGNTQRRTPSPGVGCHSVLPSQLVRVDWEEVWRVAKKARDCLPGYHRKGGYWADKGMVKRFVEKNNGEVPESIRERILAMGIQPGDRVLDIGAGGGALAVPLASMGCHVTAVEPSGPMRTALAQYARESGAPPITVIPARWEDLDPAVLHPPYDVVIASFSLMMDEIGVAVRKMGAVCCRDVHLFWFLTPPVWTKVLSVLWPRINGGEYTGGPTADILYNVLYQNGIYASLSAERAHQHHAYESLDAAVEDFVYRLNTTNEAHGNIIRTYLEDTLIPTPMGLAIPGDAWIARISWKVA